MTDAIATLAITRTTDQTVLLDALDHLGPLVTQFTPRMPIPPSWVASHLEDMKLGPWALRHCEDSSLYSRALTTTWYYELPRIAATSPYATPEVCRMLAEWCIMHDRLDLVTPLKQYVTAVYQERLSSVLASSDATAALAIKHLLAQESLDFSVDDTSAIFTRGLSINSSDMITAAAVGYYIAATPKEGLSGALAACLREHCDATSQSPADVLSSLSPSDLHSALGKIVLACSSATRKLTPFDAPLMRLFLDLELYPESAKSSACLTFTFDAIELVLNAIPTPWAQNILYHLLPDNLFTLALSRFTDPRFLVPQHISTRDRLEEFITALEQTPYEMDVVPHRIPRFLTSVSDPLILRLYKKCTAPARMKYLAGEWGDYGKHLQPCAAVLRYEVTNDHVSDVIRYASSSAPLSTLVNALYAAPVRENILTAYQVDHLTRRLTSQKDARLIAKIYAMADSNARQAYFKGAWKYEGGSITPDPDLLIDLVKANTPPELRIVDLRVARLSHDYLTTVIEWVPGQVMGALSDKALADYIWGRLERSSPSISIALEYVTDHPELSLRELCATLVRISQ